MYIIPWQAKPIPDIKLQSFKRPNYFELIKNLNDEKILGIIGARQVGTTMLYQLIDKLQNENDPKHIFFLSFDDHCLFINAKNFTRIFDLYSNNILQKPLDELESTIYIILDEIQVLKNWQNILKRWIDLRYKIKFIISGSSSSDVLKGTSESLIGRIKLQTVLQMKFHEYVQFHEPEQKQLLCTVNTDLRDGLQNAVKHGKPKLFHIQVVNASTRLAGIKDKLMVHLTRYLIQGGYPAITAMKDNLEKAELLKNYFHMTIYKDIIKTGKIRDPISLENLFTILAKESSQIINRQKISKNLEINRDTLNTYLHLLKESFLISYSEMYSQSPVVRSRNERKIYVNDMGIRNIISYTFDEYTLTDSTEMGKIIESVVADHTRYLGSSLDPASMFMLYYWRGSNEVDMIMNLYQKPLPVQVKYRHCTRDSDLRGIKEFNKKFHSKISLVVSKDDLKIKDSTIFIPLWIYLIMC